MAGKSVHLKASVFLAFSLHFFLSSISSYANVSCTEALKDAVVGPGGKSWEPRTPEDIYFAKTAYWRDEPIEIPDHFSMQELSDLDEARLYRGDIFPAG